ncbi:hypothetical protein [Hyalangium sp.]|uniref:hypothetical protein n=1 Tax=Hyalangium sp. TaxID=2028555 RepID=UPI002D2BF9A7|nr:hypothetical protein [Hyalangium sp.]HYH96023.1 hypothetical protein [Hyalangium sp.]
MRYLLLLLSLVLSLPAMAAESEDGLSTGALAVALEPVLAQAPTAQAVPTLSLEEVARLLVQAISHREWGLLLSLLLVGVVLVLRKVGTRFLPWLGTERGTATLAVVGGTSTLLALALSQGQPFSLSLLVSCLLGALTASGAWSVGKSLATPRAVPACLPEEVANGTCKP